MLQHNELQKTISKEGNILGNKHKIEKIIEIFSEKKNSHFNLGQMLMSPTTAK